MPAGLVEQHDGVGAGRDGAGDLVEMPLHGFGIGARHDDGSASAAFRADGAEQVGRGGPWIALGRLPRRAQRRVRGFFWPSRISSWNHTSSGVAGGSVLTISAKRSGSFFERSDVLGVLTMMPRALADVREAKPGQQLADRPFVVIDAEAAPDQHLQIDAAPAHHAIRLKVWPCLNEPRKLGLLLPVSRGAAPGAERSTSPNGPSALNRCTQSRSVCRSMPPNPRRRSPAHPAQRWPRSPANAALGQHL